ncbi:MAG TPA: hypothetical protein VJS64_20385 [Pyrinomonadaceae bacterium]|nr:hypothetical protein [Pyrinomonadaceae bacterium]
MNNLHQGPDGFPLAGDDRLHDAHLLLNEYLAEEVPDLERFAPDPSKWRKIPKRQVIDLIEAILRRLTWLLVHDHELRNAHVARLMLERLLRVMYTRKLPCNETDLRTMLDLTVPLLERIAPDGPVDCVMEYIRDNDLTPELCRSLHDFQEHLIQQGSVMTMQSLRQRLHTLLWMDEWEPLNPAKCWSESIRRDFRSMTGDRRQHWRRLLKHIRGNAPQRMPDSWAREAEQRLAAVGVDDFCEQLSLWFAPFRSGQPLPLSVAGSHILKGLIWYAALSRDERARDAALGLLDVKWKQKKNIEKSMVALAVFGISKEELLARNLIKEVPSPPLRILERVWEALKVPMTSSHIVDDPDGDLIVVQGQLHFYRLFRSTGRIERASDNAVLELNWSVIPDEERLHMKPECDSEEQLRHLATLLMYDSIYEKYFTVSWKK